MRIKRNRLLYFLVITLFVVAPFVMSFEDIDGAERISARLLPAFVSNVANLSRWGVLGVLLIITILRTRFHKAKINISTPVFFLSLFYLIQFSFAFVDGVDYIRFFLMTIFSLLIPIAITHAVKEDINIIKYFINGIVFFLVLSIFLNGHLVLSGQRFFGFMSNSNTYGISTVFWMVILLLADRHKLIGKFHFNFLFIGICLTMIFSGSRNAMVGVLLLLIINYYKQLHKLIGGFILLVLVFFTTAYFIDLSFVTERFQNILNATTDSGRQSVWQRSYQAIDQNFWLGNGMDANIRIADTGNMHNSYVRFVLNMGMFFTILTLAMYLLSVTSAYFHRKKVPIVLVGYLVVFALMNVGEDFFVGLGSAVFIYLLFIFGFINYYITQPNAPTR